MKKYKIAVGVLSLVAVNLAIAQTTTNRNVINFDANSVTVSTSLGFLGTKSKEYVYDNSNNRKVSELEWKAKNAPIIKGDISWDPLYWLTLTARGWTTLASSGSRMDDYDWIDPNQAHWTDWSHSPNTHLSHANEFDLNTKFWLIKTLDYKVGAVLGYQKTRFSWIDLGGGHYQYNNGSDVGSFPHGERGIGYKQKFSLPYLGLSGSYRFHDFELNALLKFSPWVVAKDNDEHYLTEVTFREKTNESKYYSASIDLGYYLTPNAKVFTEITWNKYSQGKGDTNLFDHDSGQSYYYGGDAAGIENSNYSVTAGLQYRF